MGGGDELLVDGSAEEGEEGREGRVECGERGEGVGHGGGGGGGESEQLIVESEALTHDGEVADADAHAVTITAWRAAAARGEARGAAARG